MMENITNLDAKGDIPSPAHTDAEDIMVKPVRFETMYSGGVAKDWVTLRKMETQANFRSETTIPIKSLQPKGPLDESDNSSVAAWNLWQVVEPAYEAWKKGNTLPEGDLTPLGAWHQLDGPSAEFLKTNGFTSVEDVAKMTMDQAARVPIHDSDRLPELARQWLESRAEGGIQAALEKRLEALEKENKALKKRQKEMDHENSATGQRFAGKDVTANGLYYASQSKCDQAWGFKKGTTSQHMRDGTFEQFIENEINRREEADQDYPGRYGNQTPEEVAEIEADREAVPDDPEPNPQEATIEETDEEVAEREGGGG